MFAWIWHEQTSALLVRSYLHFSITNNRSFHSWDSSISLVIHRHSHQSMFVAFNQWHACVCVRVSGRLRRKHIILCSNLVWHCHISFILFRFSSGCFSTWHAEMKHAFIVEWGRLNKKGQREKLVTLGMSLGCRFRILHRWLLWGCCILIKAHPEVTYMMIYGLKTIWINEETLESQPVSYWRHGAAFMFFYRFYFANILHTSSS